MKDRQQRHEVTATRPPLPLYGSLIARVISEAKNNFVTGLESVEKFKQIHSSLVLKHDAETPLSLMKEDCFRHDMNHIAKSNLLSGCSPKGHQMTSFFHDIAYNPHANLSYIVSVNQNSVYSDAAADGFNELCLQEGSGTIGPYQISVEKIITLQDNIYQSQLFIRFNETDLENMRPVDMGAHYYKQINIIVIDLEDGDTIQLKDDHSNVLKDILWQLAGMSEHILFQCATGVKWTGQLILLLEIFKNYSQVFSTQDPCRISEEIHRILARIRLDRPAFILNEEQFFDAIRNADILHRYVLQKGYHNNPTPKTIEHTSRIEIRTEYFSSKNLNSPNGMFSRKMSMLDSSKSESVNVFSHKPTSY